MRGKILRISRAADESEGVAFFGAQDFFSHLQLNHCRLWLRFLPHKIKILELRK